MAIDCYNLNDFRYRNLLFQIEEYELEEIGDILSELKSTTGIYIDAYGDTRLHQDFVMMLITGIDARLAATRDKGVKFILQKLSMKLRQSKAGLLLAGD